MDLMVVATGLLASTAASSFLGDVTEVLTTIVSWFGTVLTALLSTDGALHELFPFVAISFGLGVVWMVIRMVKKFVPGF